MANVAWRDLLDTPWFRVTVSVAKIVGGVALTGCIGLIGATLLRITTVEEAVASIATEQAVVRDKLEAQESIGSSFRGEVRVEIKDVQDGIADLRADVATALGILEGMRSSRSARLPVPERVVPLMSDASEVPALSH